MKKAAYGLTEAPLAWYRRLVRELAKAGFEVVRADRCLFVIRDPQADDCTDGAPIIGMCGARVDDLLLAGDDKNKRFAEVMRKLESSLPFGDL